MPLQSARYRLWMALFVRCAVAAVFAVFSGHLASGPTAIGQENGNGIVAVVNADPITRKTLADETISIR